MVSEDDSEAGVFIADGGLAAHHNFADFPDKT